MIVGGGVKCQERVVLESVSFFEGQVSNRAECRKPITRKREKSMSSKPKAHGSTETETTSTRAVRGEISAGNSAREEEIRRRAYEIYLEGGAQPGREGADWLQAAHQREHRVVFRAEGDGAGGRR